MPVKLVKRGHNTYNVYVDGEDVGFIKKYTPILRPTRWGASGSGKKYRTKEQAVDFVVERHLKRKRNGGK